MRLLAELPIFVAEDAAFGWALADVFSLARRLELSSYDASYLELAMRLGLPVATQDAQLTKAAKKCGVPLHKPSGRR